MCARREGRWLVRCLVGIELDRHYDKVGARGLQHIAHLSINISMCASHVRTRMTIFLPCGDQLMDTFSPCSASEVDVRARWASTADGYVTVVTPGSDLVPGDLLTLTRHADRPLLVKVQKRLLRGLGDRQMTGSLVAGRAGTVDSCLAAELGKYMALRCRPADGRLGTWEGERQRHAVRFR